MLCGGFRKILAQQLTVNNMLHDIAMKIKVMKKSGLGNKELND